MQFSDQRRPQSLLLFRHSTSPKSRLLYIRIGPTKTLQPLKQTSRTAPLMTSMLNGSGIHTNRQRGSTAGTRRMTQLMRRNSPLPQVSSFNGCNVGLEAGSPRHISSSISQVIGKHNFLRSQGWRFYHRQSSIWTRTLSTRLIYQMDCTSFAELVFLHSAFGLLTIL